MSSTAPFASLGSLGPVVSAQPALRPEPITLEGRYVRICPLDAHRHAASLYAASHGAENEQVWRYLFDGPFATKDQFVQDLFAKEQSSDPLFFAIEDKLTEQAVGYAALMRIDEKHRCIEVGSILYTPSLQHTSGATEAMYLMARHVFEDLGDRRYEWKCNDLNGPSKNAALRFGFSFEGIFRQHMIVKGHSRDTAWFSMLDGEWPKRRAAFEQFLSPDNFDTEGRQKIALSTLNGLGSS